MAEEKKLLVSIQEAAEMTGISRSMAYQLVADRKWPHVMVGARKLIPVVGLEDWIAKNTTYKEMK